MMPEGPRVLIVDDERNARYGMRRALDESMDVMEAETLQEGVRLVDERHPEIILLDLNLAGQSGLDLLAHTRELEPAPLVIIITAHGNEKVAVDAMKSGAHDYLAKPFELDELRLVVRNAAERNRMQEEIRQLRRRLDEARGYGSLVGRSQAMERIYALIEKVAETDVSVLITGESGSGKELVAREIHRHSPRAKGELVPVNCAAIPENLIESELFGHEKGAFTGALQRRIGKFEQARGGTLFLDEIGDMPLGTQAKILRALEERSVQRLGSNQNIDVDVRIIPLRRRRDDIPLLMQHFLESFARRYQRDAIAVSPDALALLGRYDFPGNVRQLRNIIERLVVLSGDRPIGPKELPDEVRLFDPATGRSTTELQLDPFLTLPYREARESFERHYLLRKLSEHDQNITHTAAAIGIHRQSLQQKIRDLDLKPFLDADHAPDNTA
ncbi:MAG: sigma-54 dependent transcriptional regulator [Acidobacteriota bacterium]